MWYSVGMSRLPVIKLASDMLVCGEDLGMVPKCVTPVMQQLNILGLRVQRMPSDQEIVFGIPWQYEYLTVCTPSSHDTSTLREWWEEDKPKIKEFYRLLMNDYNPPLYAETWVIKRIIQQHLYSPSMWAIFPIQEFFSLFDDLRVSDPKSERINVPSNPTHYWRYRMNFSIDHLLSHPKFINEVKDLIDRSDRKG